MQIIRINTKSDHDPLTFIRAYCDKELRKTYDKNFKDGRLVRRVGCNLYLAYQETKNIAIVSSRDFYQYIWLNIEANGAVKCITQDVEMPRHDADGKVRMRLPMGCLSCEPDPENPGKTIISAIIEGDLQG